MKIIFLSNWKRTTYFETVRQKGVFTRESIVGLLVSLLIAPLPLGARVAVGDEFQVNTYTTGVQLSSEVAAETDGDFVVVWSSEGSSGTDLGTESIQCRRYDSGGSPVGPEFQVNTYTTGNQESPAIAINADGDFIVVWFSDGSSGTDSNYRSIQGQRYNSAGSPLGDEFQVNTYTTGGQYWPAVATGADGGFVVVWSSYGSGGTDSFYSSVQGQLYDPSGSLVGGQFQANTSTVLSQSQPAVASKVDGDFVVVWQSDVSNGTDSSLKSIQGQLYQSTGATIGAEFQVNSYTTGSQYIPAVATDANGDFVMVWMSAGSGGTDSSSSSIQGQRCDSAGSPVGGEFQVNTYTTDFQSSPVVAVEADGEFTVVWYSVGSSGTDSSSRSIQGQRYKSTGSPVGKEFQVNTYTTSIQFKSAAAAYADDGLVVVWGSDGSSGTDLSSRSIQGQRYDFPEIFADGFESGNTTAWGPLPL